MQRSLSQAHWLIYAFETSMPFEESRVETVSSTAAIRLRLAQAPLYSARHIRLAVELGKNNAKQRRRVGLNEPRKISPTLMKSLNCEIWTTMVKTAREEDVCLALVAV